MNGIMLIIVLLGAFISCGKDDGEGNHVTEVVKYIEVEKEIESIVIQSQRFEGYYHLKNSGLIELMANYRGDVTVETTGQQIISINSFDKSTTEHPRIVGSDIQIINGALRWSRNENYTTGQNVKKDVDGTLVVGAKKTDYIIELISGKLKITIRIWNDKIGNTIHSLVSERTLKEI